MKRVGNVTAGFMIATAAFLDILQIFFTFTGLLIPLAWLCTGLSIVIFPLWFRLCGVKYSEGGGKKLLIALASIAAEIGPLINALPATTAGVIGIIIQSRIEDARKNAGKTVTPRTAMAAARLKKMQAARAGRADSAREEREGSQQARHTPSNDNKKEELREAA